MAFILHTTRLASCMFACLSFNHKVFGPDSGVNVKVKILQAPICKMSINTISNFSAFSFSQFCNIEILSDTFINLHTHSPSTYAIYTTDNIPSFVYYFLQLAFNFQSENSMLTSAMKNFPCSIFCFLSQFCRSELVFICLFDNEINSLLGG